MLNTSNERTPGRRRPLALFAAGVLTATLLSAPPAAAEELSRTPQAFASVPVAPVSGAESAFRDAAANWSGGATDPVGAAGGGDWTATDLAPAGSWSQGGSSGAFTYSYDMRVPPVTGPAPAVGLSYSSAAHDGLTSGTNNQASWVGDGWGYSPGFVERTYTPCAAESEKDGNQGDEPTGDQCWDGVSASATVALNGANTALVRDDDTGRWHAEDADWKVELLGTPAAPGTASTERWQITTPDGTRHLFAAKASSRWTVPVYGNHAGEPCFSAGDFTGSRCEQAYRWALDESVDVHGTKVRYTYATAEGRYSPATSPDTSLTYVREGWLERIEYGVRDGAGPAAKVEFTTGDRCLSDCRDADGVPKKDRWPDTPWKLHCAAGTKCEQHSPVFFSAKRLTAVTTYVAENGGFTKVDSWALTHEFKDYGDTEQVVLWLAAVRHTGHVGGTVTLPPTEFGGTFLPNRVDLGEAWPTIWRPRLTSIRGEAGGVTTVNYSEPDCAKGSLPGSDHDNGRRCYPSKYLPPGLTEPVAAYFHKYVVTSVAETDATGGGDTAWRFYDYATTGGGTGALWAWNDAEFVAAKDRDWNQWRGYAEVTTRIGDPAAGPQERERTRYYRGFDGDRLPGGGKRSVSVTGEHGGTATDARPLAGMEWESTAFDGTTPIESSTTWYWTARTAVRTYDGGKLEAWLTGPNRTDNRMRLSASAWRETRVETTYDGHGRPVSDHDHGDLAVTGDERCVRTTYADNTAKWLLDVTAASEAVSVGCATTPVRPRDVIGAVRAYHDGHTSVTAAPDKGLVTRTEVLEKWDGGPVYTTTGESTYDGLGRAVTTTDAAGSTTTIAYTPQDGGPVTATTTTNAAGHATTTTVQPAWGAAVSSTTPNGHATVLRYDPLGRRTAVWQPGRDAATTSPNTRFSYEVSQTRPSTVTTETLLPDENHTTSITLYDALLRERQTQSRTNGGRLVSQTEYDTHGRTRSDSGAVFNNASGPTGDLVRIDRSADPARTEYAYDGAGRVTAEVFVVKGTERWRTGYRYGGHDRYWQTTTIAPEGGTSTTTLSDARDRTVELRQHHDRAASGGFDTTTYAYTPGDRLSRVTDAAGNAWTFEYDLRGRPTANTDPDSGTTRTAYDSAGRVSSTVDGRGVRLSYGHDLLGRTTKVWAGAPTGTPMIERTYDGAANGIGLPHTATHWVDGQAWRTETRKYSQTGQPTQVYTHLPAAAGALAGSYWQSFTYHANGAPQSATSMEVAGLAREKVTYSYDDLGRPAGVTSSGDDHGDGYVYVDRATYSPYGHLLQRTLGAPENVGGSAGQAWQTWEYEEGTDRLTRFYFDKDAAGGFDATRYGVAALSYRYDDAGNILSIADDPVHTAPELAPETQCFRYDHLRRLTEAWAQANAGACAANPAPGGPGAYASAYTYDKTGNRTGDTRWTQAGPVARTYTYPVPGAAKPHTLTNVTGAGAQTAFTYDAGGYTTAVDRGGAVDTYTWTPAGRLDTIETADGTTSFVDDADGNRLLRTDPNGDRTAWVAGMELRYSAATGQVTATRYYSHGGETVGVRVGDGHINWQSDDHHGTAQWTVDGDALTANVRRTDPFGAERGPTMAEWPDQRGFVGGIMNIETGLTTLGAREYDPDLGRFASPDPISDFYDPQQVNGYAYANNNPVTMTDPDGLRTRGGGSKNTGTSGGTARAGKGTGGGGGGRGNGSGNGGSGRGKGNAQGGGTGGGGGGRGTNGNAGNNVGRAGPCDAACKKSQKERAEKEARNRKKEQDRERWRQKQAQDEARRQKAEHMMRTRVQESAWLNEGDAGLWVASDYFWQNHATSLCRLPSGMGQGGQMLSVGCSAYVGGVPPGSFGVCTGGGVGAVLALAGSTCLMHTRDDGLVVTGTAGGGGGAILDAGYWVGPTVSSARSASELAGWSNNVGASGGALGQGGFDIGISDASEWTFTANIGVGAGGGIAVTRNHTWALDVDLDWPW